MPELESLLGDRDRQVIGVVRGDAWELRPISAGVRVVTEVTVDHRFRVVVPQGVRRRLGLVGSVVVSADVDREAVLVWSTAQMDQFLEEVR